MNVMHVKQNRVSMMEMYATRSIFSVRSLVVPAAENWKRNVRLTEDHSGDLKKNLCLGNY